MAARIRGANVDGDETIDDDEHKRPTLGPAWEGGQWPESAECGINMSLRACPSAGS